MTKKGGEISIPIDGSVLDAYIHGEQLLKAPGYRDSSRLTLLGGVIQNPSVSAVLEKSSYQPWKFDIVITRMKNPRLIRDDLAYPRRGSTDVLIQSYEEAKSRGEDMVYPMDIMVSLLRLQPPPIDRVLAALEVDRMALIQELVKTTSQSQEPETF